ncbi:hypothetical protein L1987_84598 [Smallanthus sonchifolius]|uniref:Uncharacterized protein n=1 Tax=Smallanthus sonchifolius TaxID=185202 RepID=A0ACB8XTM4_9ASTR|nr:hypothetical protein L1987_84598 [Smallanthus sonchifolius]
MRFGLLKWVLAAGGYSVLKETDLEKERYCRIPRDSSVIESTSRASSTKVIGPSTGTKEFAATRIQTAYRSYRARKALRCLKGTSRFRELIEADALTKQASSALNKIHLWSKIHLEIRNRRHWMVAEGRIKQKKFENQVKFDSKLHELEVFKVYTQLWKFQQENRHRLVEAWLKRWEIVIYLSLVIRSYLINITKNP